jgi:hypothetical protein
MVEIEAGKDCRFWSQTEACGRTSITLEVRDKASPWPSATCEVEVLQWLKPWVNPYALCKNWEDRDTGT